jgi:hypothetical protein
VDQKPEQDGPDETAPHTEPANSELTFAETAGYGPPGFTDVGENLQGLSSNSAQKLLIDESERAVTVKFRDVAKPPAEQTLTYTDSFTMPAIRNKVPCLLEMEQWLELTDRIESLVSPNQVWDMLGSGAAGVGLTCAVTFFVEVSRPQAVPAWGWLEWGFGLSVAGAFLFLKGVEDRRIAKGSVEYVRGFVVFLKRTIGKTDAPAAQPAPPAQTTPPG